MQSRHEIVHVISDSHLIDSESYQRSLGESVAGSLKPGYYVVTWPRVGPDSSCEYDRNARFLGPFASRREAEMADAGATA